MFKQILSVVACILILAMISGIFWHQELKFLMPTPVPENYHPVDVRETLALSDYLDSDNLSRPVFLHFFNPDCACSTFNLDHFKSLIRDYRDHTDIYLVLQTSDSISPRAFRQKYDLQVPVVMDYDEQIAQLCGVYSTPQAVILDRKSRLYYRGNYNKTRYCTLPGSNYARIALDSLLADQPPPILEAEARVPYGCQLPKKQTLQSFLYLNSVHDE